MEDGARAETPKTPAGIEWETSLRSPDPGSEAPAADAAAAAGPAILQVQHVAGSKPRGANSPGLMRPVVPPLTMNPELVAARRSGAG
eukprot:CAMPEP_0118879356 /NCGR_PEP_ID=MMETSP1163-20130328/19158_1 /TAXON_ID=124430 /ORGANISM="Phaeomonas parva, Strain CCMP2877" /LENGTH=86 /DNA_ID=CAMNT_0006815491 /DNA_START=130 /DNA_END=387 /DNA_ORIENTATION=-